jgi:hypothetical protein
MKTLRGYTHLPPQFLLNVERIAKLILKESVGHGGGGGGGGRSYYQDFWASQLIEE